MFKIHKEKPPTKNKSCTVLVYYSSCLIRLREIYVIYCVFSKTFICKLLPFVYLCYDQNAMLPALFFSPQGGVLVGVQKYPVWLWLLDVICGTAFIFNRLISRSYSMVVFRQLSSYSVVYLL